MKCSDKIHTLGYETMSVVTDGLSYPRRLESSLSEATFSKDKTMTYAQPCNYTACCMILLPYFSLFCTWFAAKVPQINYILLQHHYWAALFQIFAKWMSLLVIHHSIATGANHTQNACQHITHFVQLCSQRIKINLLYNTPFYFQLSNMFWPDLLAAIRDS